MKKSVCKLSPGQWRQLARRALGYSLILAALALSYGFYLVDKISQEPYRAAEQQNLEQAAAKSELSAGLDDSMAVAVGTVDKGTDEPAAATIGAVSAAAVVTAAEKSEPSTAAPIKTEAATVSAPLPQWQAVAALAEASQAPTEQAAVYGYGFGYDPLYKDVRFHDHAFYVSESAFEVYAVAAGEVISVDSNGQETILAVAHSTGKSVYVLQAATVQVGQRVAMGEKIGQTKDLHFSLWQIE